MGVGTSLGQSYDDEFHYSQSQWDSKYDTNDQPVVDKAQAISIKPVQPFETPLTPQEETQFQDWKSTYAPKDSGEDYDFRGAFKAGATPDPETNHWVDTFKKPNHPTFSDQSQYAKDAPDMAGSWDGDEYHPAPYGKNPPPSKFFDRLFGLNGEERYQTWPEQAVRGIGKAFDVAQKVSSGEVSMWAQDPTTGEFHTSIEGMKNAWELMPLAMGGQIPLRIHLGQPSEVTTLKTLSEHEDEFAAMIRRYREEGFTEQQQHYPELRPAYPEQDARMANHPRWNEGNHPEPGHLSYEDRIAESQAMSEHLGHSGPNETAITSAEWRQFEADMAAYDEQHAARRVDPSAPGVGNWRRVTEAEAYMRDQDLYHRNTEQYTNEIRELLRQSRLQESWKTKAVGADTISEGQIYLSRLKSPFQEHETKHRFRFFDEKSGSKGNLSITEKQNGKQLYVEGIGLTDGINPQDIGYAGTKDMLYALKKEFPHAETVAGFRISGARAKANATGHAEMKLPKGPR